MDTEAEVRKDIRNMLDRIILSGGKKRSKGKSRKSISSKRVGAYESQGGLRAYGIPAGARAGTRAGKRSRSMTRSRMSMTRSRSMMGMGKKSKSMTKTGRRKKMTGKSPASAWIRHVKQYAKDHGINYAEALKSPGVKRGYKSGGKMMKRKSVTRKKKTYMMI